jgi:hypothetical protein
MIEADGITPSGEPYRWMHPLDELEAEPTPADKVRDARLAAVNLLNCFAAEMLNALLEPDPAQAALRRVYGIAYGMGLNVCGDVSMSERADQLGVERATLSKIACAWNAAHDLKPSFHQKTAEAQANYARVRREVVQGSKRNGALPPVPTAGRSV